MTHIETPACAGAVKAGELFTAKYKPHHAQCATPCSGCRRFYSPHLRARGRQWSACNLSATRDSGQTCRWFAPDRGMAR